ncbi:hypothetical protein [Streptomyces sp. NPDC001642]|uniref:hypothetical protein n=1 Tax=Streptomyces sp. NPDC001642 TaxID=3154392 RepID=UPI0033319268
MSSNWSVCQLRRRRAQQVEGGVLVPVVARVDRGRDADGRDTGLGDGAADDHPADVGPAERGRIVTAVEDPDGEVRVGALLGEVGGDVLLHRGHDGVDDLVLVGRAEPPAGQERRQR